MKLRKLEKEKLGGEKQPFPHQIEAFGALASTLPTPITGIQRNDVSVTYWWW